MARDEKASSAERERSLYVVSGGASDPARASKSTQVSLGRLLESLSIAPLARSLWTGDRRSVVLYRSVSYPEIKKEGSGVGQALRHLLLEIQNLWRFTAAQRVHRSVLLRTPLFDDLYYLSQHPELIGSGLGPADHYLMHLGKKGAGRSVEVHPHPLFLPDFYRATLPRSVSIDTPDALLHFLTAPPEERGEPHPLFNGRYYLHMYPDVRDAGVNPLEHYLLIGAREGRNPHPLFDTRFYLANLPEGEMRDGPVNPLVHYVLQGAARGLNPHPLFDTEQYRVQLDRKGVDIIPEIEAGTFNPLIHYLTLGASLGARPHPLFDPAYYERQLAPDELGETNALAHYLAHGRDNLKNPHPLFDTQFYLNSYPDVRRQGINPLLHYLLAGSRECRDPSPEFDGRYYAERYPDVQTSGFSALEHHVRYGMTERRTVKRFNPSERLIAQWEEAIALEPSIKARGFEHLVQAPLIKIRHSPIGDAFDWLAAQLPGSATHFFLIAQLDDSPMRRELDSICSLLAASAEPVRVAVVVTEGAAALASPLYSACNLMQVPYPLSDTDRTEVLKLLVLHTRPRVTHCIGARGGWELFQRYGRPLSTLSALCGSFFLSGEESEGPVLPGSPSFAELCPVLSAAIVDGGSAYERLIEASGLTRSLLTKVRSVARGDASYATQLNAVLRDVDGYLRQVERSE